MAVVGNLNLSIDESGSLRITDSYFWGFAHGADYALVVTNEDDARSLGKIEISYMTRPLAERYARFCDRLEKALARRHTA